MSMSFTEFFAIALHIELGKLLLEKEVIQRMEIAETDDEKRTIMLDCEKCIFEIINKVLKPDDEIMEETGKEGLRTKRKMMEEMITQHYHFFDLSSPFEEGVTFEEVARRNGYNPSLLVG